MGSNGLVDLRQIESSLIACNDISNGGRVTTDGGMVMVARDTDGKDTRITNNYIHGGKAPADGANEFYGTSGFYNEQNVVGFIFDHNASWDISGAGISLVPGASGKIGLKPYNNSVDGSIYFQRDGEADFSGSDFRNHYFVKRAYGQQLRTDMIVQSNAFKESDFADNFVIPNPLLGDFLKPSAGSPLIDRGAAIPPYTDGILGASPDVGAWEVQ